MNNPALRPGAIPSWYFVLVVVRRGDHFLIIQETKRERGWYLPAGKVDPDETLLDAARRETLEEGGIPVEIDGLLRLEFSPRPHGTAFVRLIVTAHPLDDTPPKTTPDEHSLRARWVTLPDLESLPLRKAEVRDIFAYVQQGGPIYPLALLQPENAPFTPETH